MQSLYLYAVFTFLAGFSSHKFIAWLDRLATKIFDMTIPEKFREQQDLVRQTAAQDLQEIKETVVQSETSSINDEAESEASENIETISEETFPSAEKSDIISEVKTGSKKAKAIY